MGFFCFFNHHKFAITVDICNGRYSLHDKNVLISVEPLVSKSSLGMIIFTNANAQLGSSSRLFSNFIVTFKPF